MLFIIAWFGFSIQAQDYKGSETNKTTEDKLNDEYCSGLFKTTDGTILDVASSISAGSYLNILDWMDGRVAGLQVYTVGSGIRVPVIRGSVPGIYLDEMPVSLNYLSMINTNDIAIVKVIKTPFYGGFNGGGGAIAIYTLGTEEDDTSTDSATR
ncbi:MAG TPA: hypothetical protein PKC72_12265 [Chitinophagaceae bacterium]|nr:hypothetical protein [Chitinophagaceae bacterium]